MNIVLSSCIRLVTMSLGPRWLLVARQGGTSCRLGSVLLMLVLVALLMASAQASLCSSKSTCRECITSMHACAWCLKEVRITFYSSFIEQFF